MSLLERVEKALGWATLRLLGVVLLLALIVWFAGVLDEWVTER